MVEEKEVEGEMDESEIQGTNKYGKIFPFSFCFVCFFHWLALTSSSSVSIFHSKCSIFSAEVRSTLEKLLFRGNGHGNAKKIRDTPQKGRILPLAPTTFH